MGGVVVEMLWCAAGCSVIMVVLLSNVRIYRGM